MIWQLKFHVRSDYERSGKGWVAFHGPHLREVIVRPIIRIFPYFLPLGHLLDARPLCRNVSGIFVVQVLEDFAGDFLGGFFLALFLKKVRENIRRENPRKNPVAQKQKSTKNLFCQNPALTSAFSEFSVFSCGRLPQTRIFCAKRETNCIFPVFASSCPNCKMRKI